MSREPWLSIRLLMSRLWAGQNDDTIRVEVGGEIPAQSEPFTDRMIRNGRRAVRRLEKTLYASESVEMLRERAEAYLSDAFAPFDRKVVLSRAVRIPDSPALERLARFSLQEARTVYLPDVAESFAVVSGQTQDDCLSSFVAELPDAGDREQLPYASVVIAPLLSRMEHDLPLRKFLRQLGRHGALLIGSAEAEMLGPAMVGLPPLMSFALSLGRALGMTRKQRREAARGAQEHA